MAFSLALGSGQIALAGPDEAKQVADREMAVSGIPGMAYALVENGTITDSAERGVRKAGGSDAITPDTVFILGSVSKSFTALAIMQLVEAGKLELDAPAVRYLTVLSGTPASAITVRQLLSHTSGYSIVQGNHSQDDVTMEDAALERRVAAMARITPEYAPDEKWEYSNGNYQILGRLIEVASGQTYADYVETNILAAAGMEDSFVHDAAEHANMATGHRPWFGSRRALTANATGRGSGPQGGIVASASDLARYLAMMMNGEDDLLSAAGKAQMMSPASDVSPRYGFGWFINAEDGVVYHSGSNPGYEALAMMVPAEQRAAAVLVNGGSGFAFGKTRTLRYGTASAALDLPYSGEAKTPMLNTAYILLVILPFLFLVGAFFSWRKRTAMRNNSAVKACAGIGLHLIAAFGLAYVLLVIVPTSFGAPLSAANVFQPDVGILLVAAAATSIFWALLRAFLYLTGTNNRASGRKSELAGAG